MSQLALPLPAPTTVADRPPKNAAPAAHLGPPPTRAMLKQEWVQTFEVSALTLSGPLRGHQARAPLERHRNTGVGMKRVVVHIDRLVLDGFRREDRHAIAAGLQQELGRLLAEREAVLGLRDKGDVARLRVNGAQFEPRSKPQQIGESVAQCIAKEMKP